MTLEQMLTITNLLNQVEPVSMRESKNGQSWTLCLPNDKEIKVYADGSQHWRQNGKLHREDGPAMTSKSGVRWYLNGKWHRVGGPAIIYSDGTQYWYQNGQMHRVDGPAEVWANRTQYWYLNDNNLSEDEHKKQVGKHQC